MSRFPVTIVLAIGVASMSVMMSASAVNFGRRGMRDSKGVPQGQPIARSCVVDDFEVLPDFDVQQYVGTWFTIAHAEGSVYPFHRRSHYSLTDNGQLGMTTHRIAEQGSCAISQFEADAYIPDGAEDQSKFLVQPRGFEVPPEDYWVVYTDYTDHALVYSCSLLADDGACASGSDHVWFLARSGALSRGARRHMMSLLAGLCVDPNRMMNVPTDCDEELGVALSAPESAHDHDHASLTCNVNNFQTMENFNKSQYIGTWYVIAHLQDSVYPYHRVSHYTLDDQGSLGMLTYRLTGPDGCSAAWKFAGQTYNPDTSDAESKMVLKPFGMPVPGEPYWIIHTDYTGHSLVYSCREQNDDGSCAEGAAHAWLLSRNTTLSQSARRHMVDALMDMCVHTDRLVDTPDECDAILGPESLTSQETSNDCVVHSFQTMQNFDASRYGGKWYMTSHLQETKYPYQRVSQYTVEEDGSITMTTDRITGEDTCTSGQFQATATPSSSSPAKMILRPSGMDVEGEDYWVIFTDYTDHALVYSCGIKNIDGTCQEGYSQVWLLSRRPKLSDVAHSRLASLLSGLCIDPTQLVDIPAECDEELGVSAISRCDVSKFEVMESFDISEYLGKWFVVSRLYDVYPYHRISSYDMTHDGSISMETDRIDSPGQCESAMPFEAKATFDGYSTSRAKFIFKPVGIPAEGENYWVMHANYSDHALVYSCNVRNMDGTCAPADTHAYMLSREPTLSSEAREHMETLLSGLCVDPSEMVDISSECDEILQARMRRPVTEERNCVVDEFAIMADFNINMYAGVWYTVSQIQPFDFPFHRVSNYSMQDNGRLLMSTDQFVRPNDCSTIHFEAEAYHLPQDNAPADSIRDGKLFIQPLDARIPPGKYWVVYTDYTDHALVYSCVGTGPDGTCLPGRSMAWFMSRNPSLTREAIAHMEYLLEVMCVNPMRLKNLITDCDEEIGIISEEIKSCALDDIPVKQDFIIEKFLGDWYELSHTRDNDHMELADNEKLTLGQALPGSTADISVNMRNVRVDGQCLSRDMVGSGWLGNTQAAKLVFKFPETPDGYQVPDTINYWVIDTDYTNWAITYVCHRTKQDGTCDPAAMGMWILGRARQIQPNYWTEIQGVIDSACVDAFSIQANPETCIFRSPLAVVTEPRACEATEFGCCLLSDEAAVDSDYSNCPRVPPPVAGREVPDAPVSLVDGVVQCEHHMNCKIFCRFGFVRDSNNCEICECALEPNVVATPQSGRACRNRYNSVMAKFHDSTPRNGHYVPQCDERGNYNVLQCLYPRDNCWCADVLTGERLRKARDEEGTPSCDP